MKEEEIAKAQKIVNSLYWQPAEGHNYFFKLATKKLIRFVEATSMEPEQIRLLIAYLKGEKVKDKILLCGKTYDLGEGWEAYDAWFQTDESKWNGTESKRIRIYQVLIKPSEEGADGDGAYVIENGVTYKLSRTFYWDVKEEPEEIEKAAEGKIYKIEGLTRDRETGLYSYSVSLKEELPVEGTVRKVTRTLKGVRKETESVGQNAKEGELDPPVGGSIEETISEGDKRTVRVVEFESASKEGEIVLSREHENEALEHRDQTTKILKDGDEEPEIEKIGIEDIKDEEEKTIGKRIRRIRIEKDEDTGQLRQREVVEESKQFKQSIDWEDDDSAQLVEVFRNQPKLPTPHKDTFSANSKVWKISSFVPSIGVNKFGLFDGTYHYRHSKRDGNGASSADETGYSKEMTYTFDWPEVVAGGKVVHKKYQVTKWVYHGSASGAVNHIVEEDNMDYPKYGLRRSLKTSGQRGTAEWYKNDLKEVVSTGNEK